MEEEEEDLAQMLVEFGALSAIMMPIHSRGVSAAGGPC